MFFIYFTIEKTGEDEAIVQRQEKKEEAGSESVERTGTMKKEKKQSRI